jgi:hypothetical protein
LGNPSLIADGQDESKDTHAHTHTQMSGVSSRGKSEWNSDVDEGVQDDVKCLRRGAVVDFQSHESAQQELH